MITRDSVLGRPLCALIALISWGGLVLQAHISFPARLSAGHPLPEVAIWFFSYFTILTNLVVALTLSIVCVTPNSVLGRTLAAPAVQTGVGVAITLVGLVYEALLRGIWKPQGLALIADTLLHDAVPILFLAYWVTSVPKGELTGRHIGKWLIFPCVYFLYALCRGAVTREYPYPFMDLGKVSVAQLAATTFVLVGVLLLICGAFLWADRWLGTRPVHPLKPTC